MPIRAKLVIVVFVFAILPMFLLWARWQGTAVGIITSLLREDAKNHAQEISEQLDRNLQERQARLAQLSQLPLLRGYSNQLTQNNHALPDGQLQLKLSAFLLAHQQEYAALLGLSRAGETLFKFEVQPDADGVLQPFFATRDFYTEDLLKAGK